MNKKFALVALLSLAQFAPPAFGQYIYIINKQEQFVQSGAGTTVANPGSPWHGEAQISGGTQDNSTPTGPNSIVTPGGGLGTVPLAFSSDDNQWEYQQDFTSQAALETAFPNGSYTFNSGGSSASISLTGNTYTNIPTATFSITNGVWNNDVYYILPGQSITIMTNSIAGFVPGSFRVGIDASAQNNINNYPSIKFDSLDDNLMDASGSITIPGSELQPGDVWSMELQFNSFSTINTSTGLNGGDNIGIYTMKTDVTIDAIPEPAETALLAGLLMLGAAQWRRRKV